MPVRNRLSAIELALNNEMAEREFYLKHAARTRNPVGKKMFKQIADDELEHYERLKQLHDLWQKNENWPETIPLYVKDTNVKKILESIPQMATQTLQKDSTDLEALKTAIVFEDKGVKFYSELAEASLNSKEKGFFNLLSNIEREHFLSLKDVEEYLTDPSAWYIKMEHHGMDGA